MAMRLYTYWRSSAAFRVRIALGLKGVGYESVPRHLLRAGGEQRQADYLALNPQGLVPGLEHDGGFVAQSLAICEYLEEIHPEPRLLPGTALDRARIRAMALAVACDIHPLNNLRVLQYLEREWGVPQPERDNWVRHWIVAGFDAFEAMLAGHPSTGTFCDGNVPTLADCCMVPQLYNARRFGVNLDAYPTMLRVEQACMELPAFQAAQPERQPDAPKP